MKTVENNHCEVTYASVIADHPLSMTRKRLSDEVHYPPVAVEPDEELQVMMVSGKNKLPRFEYVTQISADAGVASSSHHLLTSSLNYCETVDFHNEKGQRIFLTDSENAEFVNIMLQDNLLSVQAPMNGSCEVVHGGGSAGGGVELIELNSAELLDLDGKGKAGAVAAEQSSGIVTFVNHSDNGNDFEKQLVCVEIQDDSLAPPPTNTNTTGRGQTVNICQQQRRGQHHQHGNEDLEDKNLSWLFNFKLDELPHLSPEVSHRAATTTNPPSNRGSSSSSSSIATTSSSPTASGGAHQKSQDRRSSMQESESMPEKVQKKPPFTYTELIEYALEDQSELTVSGIYQWISDRFPYYKSNDDRWKNSVRHNLSINPHFRKGSKAPQGAGHLWTIASRDSEANNLAWEHKKQRLELFFKMEAAANLAHESERQSTRQQSEQEELLAATASIMLPGDDHHHLHHGQTSSSTSYGQESLITSHYFTQTDPDSQQIIYDTVDSSDDLCRVASEILSGVRRNVEVQIIHPNVSFDTVIDSCYTTEDYLNPVPKDDIMRESGLRSQQCIGQDFFVTEEIDPVELGINMTTNGEEVFFSDDFNHYFGHNIVA